MFISRKKYNIETKKYKDEYKKMQEDINNLIDENQRLLAKNSDLDGKNLELEIAANALMKNNERLNTIVQSKNNILNQKKEHIDTLQINNDLKDDVINNLKKEIHNLKISIGLYKKSKERKSEEKKEFLKIIDEYKNEIIKLEKENKSLKNKPTIEELRYSHLKIDKKKYKGFKSNRNEK